MTPSIRPLHQVNETVTAVLIREIGVVDTLRFLSQFPIAGGNYTEERKAMVDSLSLDDIFAGIAEMCDGGRTDER